MNKVILPAGTTLGKSFEYGVDVNLGTYADPLWQSIRRLLGYQPTDTPTTQDAQTYDDQGAPNNDVTGWGWGLAFNVQVHRFLNTGLFLPEVEYLLDRTRPHSVGELAVADVRWYHKPAEGTPNPNDAGRGLATVAKTRQNIGPGGEIEMFGFSLSGKGAYEEIANPFTGWSATAPKVSAVIEVAAGDGELITIVGEGLLDATGVTIGGTSVEFVPVNGATVIAQMPTGDAGDVAIIVTTPGGPSPAFTYTRGA
ncbi:phage tail tube protein [Microbacterium trichothecenolyticum]|uniref:phage tail tube protein n=1 Tax=Microbacterium trichothecenolyticum TaxID=69370 RepID=UPI0035BEA247